MHRVFRVFRSGAGFRPGPIWSSRLFGGADRLADPSTVPGGASWRADVGVKAGLSHESAAATLLNRRTGE